MTTLAASFLAGSILTLLIPCGLFIVVGLWHLGVVKRLAKRTGEESPAAGIRSTEAPAER